MSNGRLVLPPWFPVQIGLHRHPKIAAIVAACETIVDVHQAVGLMVDCWGWANEYSEDGIVTLTTRDLFDIRFGHPGLAKAMESVGWLRFEDRAGVPCAVFVNYHRFCRETVQRRWHDRQRKARQRDNGGTKLRLAQDSDGTESGQAGTQACPPCERSRQTETKRETERETAAGARACVEESACATVSPAQEALEQVGFDSGIATELASIAVGHGRPEGTNQYVADLLRSADRLYDRGHLHNRLGWLRRAIQGGYDPIASVVSHRTARSRHAAQAASDAKAAAERLEETRVGLEEALEKLPQEGRDWIVGRVRELMASEVAYDAKNRPVDCAAAFDDWTHDQRMRSPLSQGCYWRALGEWRREHPPPPDQSTLKLEYPGGTDDEK